MTPLTTPIFDFHLAISALTTLTQTPSLVETSLYGEFISPNVFISDGIAILFSLKTFYVVHHKLIRHTPNALMIHKDCLSMQYILSRSHSKATKLTM